MNYKVAIPLIIVCSIAVALGVWAKMSSPRIAYVRSAELFQKYQGMQEAKNIYKGKMSKWQSNIDTLQNDYQRSLNHYNLNFAKLNSVQRQEQEMQLKKQQANIQQYIETMQQRAKEEDDKMTEGVINQINSFIKVYGEENSYDVILGVTLQGSVLYGKEQIDITEEIIAGLNESYIKGKE